MLNPPLALLSVELLDSIVEHLGQELWPERDLKSLALADRCFTHICQRQIFAEFACVAHAEGDWKQQLRSFHYTLTTNPNVASWVRVIKLIIHGRVEEGTWIFQETLFESTLAQLKITERPPDSLEVYTSSDEELPFREPDLVLRVLSTMRYPDRELPWSIPG
ncbi:hypothetical protein BKA70DRAFT_1463312 [Coprinopsis sp. MPI-PUGE-AT-0042]|nr:hypothetical protein BKA70DRAFT_1463312 [Coprinopsis sp. MPI-PUGE-AT-0042]